MTDSQSSQDFGLPAQLLYQDLEGTNSSAVPGIGSAWTIQAGTDDTNHVRVKLLTQHGSNGISDIWILRKYAGAWHTTLHLNGTAAQTLIAIMRNTSFDDAGSSTLPESNLIEVPNLESIAVAYEHNPKALASLIAGDIQAEDVIAVAHRREVLNKFEKLLTNDSFFQAEFAACGGISTEKVWQIFFEANPWLLGLGLGSQLFVGWDNNRLEQIVVGHSVSGPGKRTDALMKTAGAIQLVAFAEIKHHKTDLLGEEYRTGCWSPSKELSGAVAQIQNTVQLAQEAIGTKLQEVTDDGYEDLKNVSYLYTPQSFVVAGRLTEFVSSSGAHHVSKVRSFELFRRNLGCPSVLTFDEVFERSKVLVSALEDSGSLNSVAEPTD